MGDEKPPPVLGSAAYPIPRPGMGRARGRARAMPLTQGKEGRHVPILTVLFLQSRRRISGCLEPGRCRESRAWRGEAGVSPHRTWGGGVVSRLTGRPPGLGVSLRRGRSLISPVVSHEY